MSEELLTGYGPDYDRCTYGNSLLSFRGPYRIPQAVDVAVLGGTETFGKYITVPYPELLEHQMGRSVVNLGAMNAGVDSFCSDSIIEEVAHRAHVAVVQIMGAQSVSNPFYRVHARRNDRVVAVTDHLRSLFPDLDFTDCNFTRHLLVKLQNRSPSQFQEVVFQLQKTWLGRMRELIARLSMPTVLLWVSDREPCPDGEINFDVTYGDPLFVTRDMVYQISSLVDGFVEIVRSYGGEAELDNMVFSPIERAAAARLPGPSAHAGAATALAKALQPAFGQVYAPPQVKRSGQSR